MSENLFFETYEDLSIVQLKSQILNSYDQSQESQRSNEYLPEVQSQEVQSQEGQRPSWQEYFKDISLCTAKRSPCHRLHVGCILVKDNRIISTGYNGFLPGAEHISIIRDDHEQATVHAEQNALMCCAKLGISCDQATLYITHYPCIICCRMVLAAGIKEIKYINDYKNDPLVEKFCNQLNVKITKI